MSRHHKTLGVSPQSDPAAIDAAYRALMKRHHPDRTIDDAAEAHVRACRINDAYRALRTPRSAEAVPPPTRQPPASAWNPVTASAPRRPTPRLSGKGVIYILVAVLVLLGTTISLAKNVSAHPATGVSGTPRL